MTTLTPADAYEQMFFIRKFEESVLGLCRDGAVAGSVHLCMGQEAIPVGAASALGPQDRVLATYRGHGWALACGSSPAALLAEIAQREAGTNGGRGGSPFLSDPDNGFFGENSIVGAGVPIAVGVALASISTGSGRVVLTSIGDGAMNQGAVSEGLVFAAIKNLPVIVLCENNGWSEMTPIASMMRGDDLVERARGLGIESHVVDGDDPFSVRDAVLAAAQTCRDGQGPVFLECKTSRLSGHYNRDVEHYRPQADKDASVSRDPLVRLAAADPGLTRPVLDAIEARVVAKLETLILGLAGQPQPRAATVFDHLYGPAVDCITEDEAEPVELTYQRAINLALRTELDRRPEVLVYGEDIGYAGGIFGVTRGLQKEYGAERVFDTPIAESAILGSAVGASLEGMRPVVEIMWADFIFVALDQIVNQAANVRYVNRSKLSAPLTVRMQQGVTPGSCAQHSQSIEAMLAHVPGLKVGLPATSQDAYSMLRAAVADPDPTILIEHRALYQRTGTVVTGGQIERAEGARFHKRGGDIAIITWGAMLHTSLAAAEALDEQGVAATVLDLRWLRPVDANAVDKAVRECRGRVVVVHEAVLGGGFGAELVAQIADRNWEMLSGPVVRVATPDIRMPSAPNLQEVLVPSADRIVEAAHAVIEKALAAAAPVMQG